jgi:hypothetical protein
MVKSTYMASNRTEEAARSERFAGLRSADFFGVIHIQKSAASSIRIAQKDTPHTTERRYGMPMRYTGR